MLKNDLETALRRVSFLRGVPVETIAAVREAGILRRLVAGATLFREGDSEPGLCVVVAGRIKLAKWDARGRELTLGVAGQGEIVGAPATFDGGNCPYDAMALDVGATIFIVTPEAFRGLLAAHPIIALGVVRFLAVQNRRLIEMLKAQTLHSVRARFASYLLAAAGDTNTFVLLDSNVGIAAHLGTVREVVSRTLHQFADLGYISVQGRAVTLIKADELRQMTN